MRASKGYTLLELGIAITIIGVTAGGIFVTQTLVRASHLNRLLSEYDSYVKAMSEFQDKFLAYPGDMNNAVSMWGADPAGCPNTPYSATLKLPTCNGNGDGRIGDSDLSGNLSETREWFRAWQHMANAGFITDHYSGIAGPGGAAEALPGINVPASSIHGAGWTLHYYQMVSAATPLWADTYGHVINYGANVAGGRTVGPVLTGEEAVALDRKVDDGKPGRGIIRAWRTALLPACTVSDTTQDAQAYSTSSARVCALVFLLGM